MDDESFIIGTDPYRWTVGAIYCYKRGCNCRGCFIPKTYPETLYNRCSMKYCVRKLIRKYGLPDDVTLDGIIQEEK